MQLIVDEAGIVVGIQDDRLSALVEKLPTEQEQHALLQTVAEADASVISSYDVAMAHSAEEVAFLAQVAEHGSEHEERMAVVRQRARFRIAVVHVYSVLCIASASDAAIIAILQNKGMPQQSDAAAIYVANSAQRLVDDMPAPALPGDELLHHRLALLQIIARGDLSAVEDTEAEVAAYLDAHVDLPMHPRAASDALIFAIQRCMLPVVRQLLPHANGIWHGKLIGAIGGEIGRNMADTIEDFLVTRNTGKAGGVIPRTL